MSTSAPSLAIEIAEQTARFLTDLGADDGLRAAGGWDADRSRALTTRLIELGWHLLLMPSEAGGLGAGAAEVVALLTEVGLRPLPAPVLDLVVTGPLLLEAADLDPALADGIVQGERLFVRDQLGTGTWSVGADGLLSGSVPVVDFADTADQLVLATTAGSPSVVVVDLSGPGVEIDRLRSIDSFARPGSVRLTDVPVVASLAGAAAQRWLDESRRLRLLAAGAELTGIARRATTMSADYARQRVQFGRPIGSFQAIQHLLGLMWVDTYAAESLCGHAAASGDRLDLAMECKAFSAEIAQRVCQNALQVHGAIGYTEELTLSASYRRMLTLIGAEGEVDDLYEAVGRTALTGGSPS